MSQSHLDKKLLRQIGLGCVNFNLKKASRETDAIVDRQLSSLRIKSTQFSILMGAAYLSESSMIQLAEMLGIDRTTLTKNLKPLQRDGYLLVTRGEDRRRQIIKLTLNGENLLTRALPLRQKAHDKIVSILGKNEYRLLIKSLRHFERNSRTKMESGNLLKT